MDCKARTDEGSQEYTLERISRHIRFRGKGADALRNVVGGMEKPLGRIGGTRQLHRHMEAVAIAERVCELRRQAQGVAASRTTHVSWPDGVN